MQRQNRKLSMHAPAQGQAAAAAERQYVVYQCLIVSTDAERREMLASAARESGWEPVVCEDALSAWTATRRMFLQLAIIDLASHDGGELHALLERLGPSRDMLVVICGNESRAEEEIWARGLGVWLYLPGVVEQSSVALLGNEARHIVDRLHQSATAPRPASANRRRAM